MRYVCEQFEVVVIGDTIPHGRAVLESIAGAGVEDRLRCNSKVVVEMTNRFDWAVEDEELPKYYEMFRELVRRSRKGGDLHEKVVFVGNNLAEGRWLEGKIGVPVVGEVKVLRPLGVVPSGIEYPKGLVT